MKPKRWKPVFLLVLIGSMSIAMLLLDVGARLKDLRDEIEAFGAWAPVVFISIYVISTTAMVPGAALTVMAGGLFGTFWGVVYVNIAATLGAVICFLIARKFARKAVGDWFREKPQFQKLDAITTAHGPAIVAATRLVPVFPYNFLNYGFGLTGVGFWPHLLLTWICMIPNTLLYVLGAEAVAKWLNEGVVPWALLGIAIVLLSALLFLGFQLRRKWGLTAEPTDSEIKTP